MAETMTCPDCGSDLTEGQDQYAGSWICGPCRKTVRIPSETERLRVRIATLTYEQLVEELVAAHPDSVRFDRLEQCKDIGQIEPPEAFPDRLWTIWDDGDEQWLGRGKTLREAVDNWIDRSKAAASIGKSEEGE